MARLSSEQIRFLASQRIARLATVDEAGSPHVVPICFAQVDGTIYTAIDEKPKQVEDLALRRVRNILKHPDVCFLADHYDDDWARLAWLQVRGQASLVTNTSEQTRALKALRDRYPPYRKMDLESHSLIRITPQRVVAWAASNRPPSVRQPR